MSFENRLIEARARREKVLAERAAKTRKTGQKAAPTSLRDAQKPGTQQAGQGLAQIRGWKPIAASLAMMKSTYLKKLAAKAVFVFSAAVGLGIGLAAGAVAARTA